MRQVLKNVWDGVDLKQIANERDLNKEKGLVRCYLEFARVARTIVNSLIFQNSITFTILVASIVVGVQTDEKITADHPEIFYWLEWTILWIFTIEITLKFIEVTHDFSKTHTTSDASDTFTRTSLPIPPPARACVRPRVPRPPCSLTPRPSLFEGRDEAPQSVPFEMEHIRLFDRGFQLDHGWELAW